MFRHLSFVWVLACSTAAAAATVELSVVERQGAARRGEPVTFGVPLPKGELASARHVRLLCNGKEVPAQFRAVGLWRPDPSIRRLLVDFQTGIEAHARRTYTLQYDDGTSAKAQPAAAVHVAEGADGYKADTGAASFPVSKSVFDLFYEVRLAVGTVIVPPPETARPRFGAIVRGLKPMVTRAIPGTANKGRSHLICAEYMSPQKDPGGPERNNRMGWRGDGCTLNRLLEGYLLSGDENYLQRARRQIKSCAYDGKPPKHEPISLWSSLFYMEVPARHVELFPGDAPARACLLAHAETLRKGTDPANGIFYTVTPRPDGSVVGSGECSHYNIPAADIGNDNGLATPQQGEILLSRPG